MYRHISIQENVRMISQNYSWPWIWCFSLLMSVLIWIIFKDEQAARFFGQIKIILGIVFFFCLFSFDDHLNYLNFMFAFISFIEAKAFLWLRHLFLILMIELFLMNTMVLFVLGSCVHNVDQTMEIVLLNGVFYS